MRVIIVDDHSLFRDGIRSLLEAAGFQVIGQAGDGTSALALLEQLQPDLVLLDIHMPGISGLETLKRMKALAPATRVVMLTVSEDEQDLLTAIQSGADGFLLKHLSATEFIAMLEGIKHGEPAISRKTTAYLMRRIAQAEVPTTPISQLSERELEILRLLAQGLPNKQISEKLNLSENTVKYHLKNLLRKLNVQNRTEAVMKAIQTRLIER